jgi:hypothetical protein
MKIYIPTLGRSNNQITFDNLPKFLQDKTTLVVQPHEKDLYNNYPIMVLPEDWIGISRTRKYIIDNAGNNIFGMMDDDIKLKRRFSESPTKRPLTEDDWKEFYNMTIEWLQNDVSFVGIRRGNVPPVGKDWIENSETIVATFYNGSKLPDTNELNWNHDLLSEDVNLHLQLLLKGHKNRVWSKYGYVGDWAQDGGCQEGPNKRTVDLMNKSHEKLIEMYPDFVKWKTKNGVQIFAKHSQKFVGFKMIKCYYNKAAKYSGRGVLPI